MQEESVEPSNEKEKKKDDVDITTFADSSIKVSVDPERTGEVLGELIKRSTKRAVSKILKRRRRRK